MILLVAPLCVAAWVDTHARPMIRAEGRGGAGLGRAEPRSNLRRQFWQPAPEKWQEYLLSFSLCILFYFALLYLLLTTT